MSIQKDKDTIRIMISMYCSKKEKNLTLCPECQALLHYAYLRLEFCRFKTKKPTCKKCPIHCYSPDKKEKMRQVMRFAGPRMLFYHPILAARHLWKEW